MNYLICGLILNSFTLFTATRRKFVFVLQIQVLLRCFAEPHTVTIRKPYDIFLILKALN